MQVKCMHVLLSARGYPPELRECRSLRSLSQQALMDLQQACGGDPRERR
ncbi:MAG: hypothetical protein RLZZ216_1480 [Cyanobacteriota bacterium]